MDANTQKKTDNLKALCAAFHRPLQKLEEDGRILRKSKLISTEARKAGNELYIKENHDSHMHKVTLSQYSRSVAFAPNGSEELALAYSNRSILLMHMNHYKESLIDIDRALKITKDDVFKAKLQARKQKCLGLINEEKLIESAKNLTLRSNENQESFSLKLKNFDPSVILPCASDCVGLVYNDTFGRHLVATRDIKPGEILIVEEGYVCCPEKCLIYVVCTHCLQIAWNGMPCDNCVFAIYCSEACKNQAFQDYHDIECSMLKYMDYIADKMCDRMAAIRLLVTAVKKESFQCIINQALQKSEKKGGLDSLLSDGVLRNNKFKSYYNLLSHAKDVESENEDDVCESIMVYLLAEHTNFFSVGHNSASHVPIESHVLLSIKNILTKLQHILDTNAFRYQAPLDCDCQTIDECKNKTCNSSRGIFLAPTCSLLNHSCTPNVSRIYVPKRKVIVFANSPIKKGEQLYDSYGVIYTDDVKVRQNILKQGFHFTCKCAACRDRFKMTEASYASKDDWENIMTEYQQCYPQTIGNSFFVDSVSKCELSEDYLQHVKKLSELFYKHLDYYTAFAFNDKCRAYIEILLLQLYGEKYVIPNDF